MNLATIAVLGRYHAWANEQVLDAASHLTPEQLTRDLESSHGSVRDTLTHIVWSEWIWLERWKGMSPSVVFAPANFSSVGALRERFQSVAGERSAFLRDLTPDDLVRVTEYRNLKGETWRYPLWQQIHHVVNHSTYHRGQVVTMLRQLGAAAPATDLLVYFDQGGS